MMTGLLVKYSQQLTRISFLMLALLFLSNTICASYFQTCDIDPIEMAEKCSEKSGESECEELDIDEFFIEFTSSASYLYPKKHVVDRHLFAACSFDVDILTPPPERA